MGKQVNQREFHWENLLAEPLGRRKRLKRGD
jgi:hypothetical protein